jgi:prepilin peptidase CpaA
VWWLKTTRKQFCEGTSQSNTIGETILSPLLPLLRITLALLVILAALFDYRSRRIPNWLTLTGAITGIVLQSALHRTAGLTTSLKGMGLALLIYIPLYLLRGVGGGDVKLMAAVGAISGPANWLAIMLLTALVGGIFAIFLIAFRHRIGETLRNIGSIAASISRAQPPFKGNPQLDVRSGQALRLPHAVVIACATILFLAASAFLPA